MQETLFRGKTYPKKNNQAFNNEWVYGDLLSSGTKIYIHPKANIFRTEGELSRLIITHEVIPETIGLFTGVTDKKGNPIFNGDIVLFCMHAFEWRDPKEWELQTGSIVFEDGCFRINGICSSDGYNELSCIFNEIYFCDSYADCVVFEVIGNIHDNPELLNATTNA